MPCERMSVLWFNDVDLLLIAYKDDTIAKSALDLHLVVEKGAVDTRDES